MAESAWPSPFGLIVAGSAARPVIASGPATTTTGFPNVPDTGVAPATSIRQLAPAAVTSDASQV